LRAAAALALPALGSIAAEPAYDLADIVDLRRPGPRRTTR
jgi:hypothetical protein